MIGLACRATHCRRPLLARLVRGCLGISLLVVAALKQAPLLAVAAFLAALVAFGGCPMCWTFSLVELASQKFKPPVLRKDAP